MSRQMKKKEINKYRVEMWKLRKINSELKFWKIEYQNRCQELSQDITNLQLEIRELKAGNYSFKKRGLIDRIMNRKR